MGIFTASSSLYAGDEHLTFDSTDVSKEGDDQGLTWCREFVASITGEAFQAARQSSFEEKTSDTYSGAFQSNDNDARSEPSLRREEYRGFAIFRDIPARVLTVENRMSVYDISREHLGLADKKRISLKEDLLIRKIAREICRVNELKSIWNEATQGQELEIPGHTNTGSFIRTTKSGVSHEFLPDGRRNKVARDGSHGVLHETDGSIVGWGPNLNQQFRISRDESGGKTIKYHDGSERKITFDVNGSVAKLTERNGDEWVKTGTSTWILTETESGAEVTRFHGNIRFDKNGNLRWTSKEGHVVLESPDGELSTTKQTPVKVGETLLNRPGNRSESQTRMTGKSFTAVSSWYGPGFHGRKAADGSRFDMHELTAAHKSLRFGTVVEVTNPATGKVVQVKITDRGPFTTGRSLDLSMEAARQIGLIERGVASVQCRIVRPPK